MLKLENGFVFLAIFIQSRERAYSNSFCFFKIMDSKSFCYPFFAQNFPPNFGYGRKRNSITNITTLNTNITTLNIHRNINDLVITLKTHRNKRKYSRTLTFSVMIDIPCISRKALLPFKCAAHCPHQTIRQLPSSTNPNFLHLFMRKFLSIYGQSELYCSVAGKYCCKYFLHA